jgi:hypothetical protein
MLELIFTIWGLLSCSNHTNTAIKHSHAGQVTVNDTGGETGTIPPNPPPPTKP